MPNLQFDLIVVLYSVQSYQEQEGSEGRMDRCRADNVYVASAEDEK